MTFNKYINTTDVVKLTGQSRNEIHNLAKTGVLSCHKTRRGHWRFNIVDIEEHFGIKINTPALVEEKQLNVKSFPITSEQVVKEKFISRLAAKKYLNCSNTKFESLVKEGIIRAHRDETMRWRVSKESVLRLVEQTSINNSQTHKYKKSVHKRGKQHLSTKETSLIINENHYQEVLERISTAKTSIKIMTADFKRFNLKPTGSQGKEYKDGTPFIKYLMTKAVQGVSVQIICSRPSSTFTEELKEYYRQMMNPILFKYKYCERNHAKVVIVDDMFAYIGSANVTPAGLGQGIFTPGNFEAGIITEDLSLISSAKELFSLIWNDNYCVNCHRADKCKE